ncbi:hypothetical protein COB55_01325 [Candidatus Wolfebacteria bacterium]|nr:MAG: hypothetical protein COB55_01325 [Candidatus Wolfebacteria bacterium]
MYKAIYKLLEPCGDKKTLCTKHSKWGTVINQKCKQQPDSAALVIDSTFPSLDQGIVSLEDPIQIKLLENPLDIRWLIMDLEEALLQ